MADAPPVTSGWALVPVELDNAMRLAIWRAQAGFVHPTPEAAESVAKARVDYPPQREQDRLAWQAMHEEAARRLRDG